MPYMSLDVEQAYKRKATLERRKEVLRRGMELHGERDERGLRSDRWEELAELYDRCDDQIAECEKDIAPYEEEEAYLEERDMRGIQSLSHIVGRL